MLFRSKDTFNWECNDDEVVYLIMHIPVSYTHLDVYKRQAFFGIDLGGFTGSRRFVNQIPVNGIRKGGLQERVDLSLIHI